MQDIKLRSVSQVLVGLHRVGLTGLEQALLEADASDLRDRKGLVDLIMKVLTPLNYIPQSAIDDYRQAVWREYQRHQGEDIRDLYSEIEVEVRGRPGEELDRFVETLTAVLAEHELKPLVRLEPPGSSEELPELLIAGQPIIAGTTRKTAIRKAVSRQISDW